MQQKKKKKKGTEKKRNTDLMCPPHIYLSLTQVSHHVTSELHSALLSAVPALFKAKADQIFNMI